MQIVLLKLDTKHRNSFKNKELLHFVRKQKLPRYLLSLIKIKKYTYIYIYIIDTMYIRSYDIN